MKLRHISELKKLSVLLIAFFIVNHSNAQIFHWYDDGYVWQDSIYSNVDNSGIDIEIHLIDYFSSAFGPFTGSNYNKVRTGINNMQGDSLQHEYRIYFSESVDVEFQVSDINEDSTFGQYYNDLLVLGEEANVLSSVAVTLSADSVYPALDGGGGWIHVRYSNVDSIRILHGFGEGPNPGFIEITPLIINGNILNVPKLDAGMTPSIVQLDSRTLEVENLKNVPQNIQVLDLKGSNVAFNQEFNEQLRLTFSNVNPGIYILQIVQDNGEAFRQKFSLGL